MTPLADAWKLIERGRPIDSLQFLRALRLMTMHPIDDERSRLLLRDGLQALRKHWGDDILQRRMINAGFPRGFLGAAIQYAPDEKGFATLGERIVDATDPNTLSQMLRELGKKVRQPTTIYIGGSMTLIWDALVVRKTDDVDVVDEVPSELRANHGLLADIQSRYGLKLAHFQSHYLPHGWQARTKSLGKFGELNVFRIDPIDVLVGKLFSVRVKDRDDVRLAWPMIDQEQFRGRLVEHAKSMTSDARLTEAAIENWYIITGEQSLPT